MNPPFVKTRPHWYCGEILPRSQETGNCGELSGHVLDEIIDEKLTNPDFVWTGKNGIASFLGLDMRAVKEKIWIWNTHKIRFAPIAPDTPDSDPAIRQIAGLGPQGKRCWQRYRHFIDSGGCPLPVDPALLFSHIHPEKELRLPSQLSNWSDFRSVEVGAGGSRKG